MTRINCDPQAIRDYALAANTMNDDIEQASGQIIAAFEELHNYWDDANYEKAVDIFEEFKSLAASFAEESKKLNDSIINLANEVDEVNL